MSHKKYCKIAGVVVLYHPDNNFRENIDTYIDDIDILFAIDNTETPFPHVKAQLPKDKTIYIPYHDNRGIAKALNDAASLAIQQGCDFLLTMDQDSKATRGMISHMLTYLMQVDNEKIGIVAPYHVMSHLKDEDFPPQTCRDVLTTMTSGNLLNLKAYEQTGPFTDSLFIDAVDFDYCLRLHQKGFRVIEVYEAKLIHHLGNVTKHNLFGRKVYATHHSAVRRYYITRNYLYMIRTYKSQYPGFCRYLTTVILSTPLVVILFEKNKLEKLKMIVSGVIDYAKGIYGKYRGI